MNMDKKKLAQETAPNLAGKQYLAKAANLESFVNKIPWTVTFIENNQSFSSIADFFVHFTTLCERNVSLQEEKSNVSGRAGSE